MGMKIEEKTLIIVMFVLSGTSCCDETNMIINVSEKSSGKVRSFHKN